MHLSASIDIFCSKGIPRTPMVHSKSRVVLCLKAVFTWSPENVPVFSSDFSPVLWSKSLSITKLKKRCVFSSMSTRLKRAESSFSFYHIGQRFVHSWACYAAIYSSAVWRTKCRQTSKEKEKRILRFPSFIPSLSFSPVSPQLRRIR